MTGSPLAHDAGAATRHDLCADGGRIDWSRHRALRMWATAWGAGAALLLLAVYLGTLAAANSLDHAVDEFVRLRYWMVPLVSGFALQIGLFAYAKRAVRSDATPSSGGVVASGGASTLSMVACCAHHLTDALPLVGLAGAATLLAAYQGVFLLLGVLSNLVGLVYVLGLLKRHGLYPDRPSVLSLSLRWPVHRALIPTLALAAVVFATALLRVAT